MRAARGYLLLVLFAAGALGAAAAPSDSRGPWPYRSVKTVFLGSPEEWDHLYFDSTSRRVYVAHGSEVTVVDGKTGVIAGRVAGFAGVHGLVAIPDLQRGYAVSRGSHSLLAFDLNSLQVSKSIPIDDYPDSLTYDPVSRRIVVADGQAPLATIVDPSTDSVVSTVQLGGGAEQAVPDGQGGVFINLADQRQIIRLNLASGQIDQRWPIPRCESPHGIAIDAHTQRLFVSCVNSVLLVVNAANGHVLTHVPIGKGTDGCVYDPTRNRILSSNGWDGTLSVIAEDSPGHYRRIAEVPTARFGRTLALDPATGRVYIAAADLERMDPNAPNKWAQYVMKVGSVRLLVLDPADR